MTLAELKAELDKRGVREDAYCLAGGLPNEALTIEKIGNTWLVYYSERGARTGIRRFDNESDACDTFLREITS